MFKKLGLLLIFIFVVNSLTAQKSDNIIEKIKTDKWRTIEKVDIPGEVYKITDKISGRSYYKNLSEYNPDHKLKKSNVVVDTTVIYPDLVDTTQFEGMYEYWTKVDIGTTAPIPIIAGDVNQNGSAELYGERYNSYLKINERSIYEYNPAIDALVYKTDMPWDSISTYRDFTQIYDINMDGKDEVFLLGGWQTIDSILQ